MSFKVTIVIPAFNAENTIEKCVLSAIQQTMKDIEIVIINDGSFDDTGKRLEEISGEYGVRVVCQNNSGVSKARNCGIDCARGEYIFFLDSDDWIDQDLIEKMYSFGKDYNLDLISCSHDEVNSTIWRGNVNNANKFIANDIEEIGTNFFNLFPKSACAKLFKKKIIDTYHLRFPANMHFGEDLYFSYQFILHVEKVGKIEDTFYHIQNINLNSLSKKYVSELDRDLEIQYELWESVFRKYPKAKEEYYKNNVFLPISIIATYADNLHKKGCSLTFGEKRKLINKYLKAHREWISIKIPDEQMPKNFIDKCSYIVVRSQNVTVINIFFALKEIMKQIRVYVAINKRGKNEANRTDISNCTHI